MRPPQSTATALAAFVLALSLSPQTSHAQGWAPASGTGTVSLAYQYTTVWNHLFGSPFNRRGINIGRSRDFGDITGQSITLDATYVLVPRLLVSAGVAWVGAKYVGNLPESETLDDGKFRGTMQDMSLGVGYSIPLAGFNVVPSMGFSFPTHEYEHHGHAAPGAHNTSLGLGLGIGRGLAPLLPDGYLQVGYGHGIVKDVGAWGVDNNRYNVTVGYYLLPQFNVQGYFSYFEVKNGIDWLADDLNDPYAWHFHDAAAATLVRRAGGSVRYQFDASRGMFLDVGGVLSGQNTHDGVSVTMGTTWSFIGPFAR